MGGDLCRNYWHQGNLKASNEDSAAEIEVQWQNILSELICGRNSVECFALVSETLRCYLDRTEAGSPANGSKKWAFFWHKG